MRDCTSLDICIIDSEAVNLSTLENHHAIVFQGCGLFNVDFDAQATHHDTLYLTFSEAEAYQQLSNVDKYCTTHEQH